jgi:hypothetical protein
MSIEQETAKTKLLTHEQRERERRRVFRPVAVELAWLIYEWNRLHAGMGELFAVLVPHESQPVLTAVWHTLTAERIQWDMLKNGAAAAKFLPKGSQEDINWLIKQMDNLGGKRNDAVHSPLIFVNDYSAETIDIMPFLFLGNPRARSLFLATKKEKTDLITEFGWYRDHLARLATFAQHLAIAIPRHPNFEWPERPQLPTREQFAKGKAKRRPGKTKLNPDRFSATLNIFFNSGDQDCQLTKTPSKML